MYYQNTLRQINASLVTLLILVAGSARAEDIEIFSHELPPSKPNVLFLLDHSGSMNRAIGTNGQTRLTALRSAFNAVMSDPDIAGLKVGLMGFSNGVGMTPYPHGVSFPVSGIDDAARPIMLSNVLAQQSNNIFTLADDNLPDPASGQTVRSYLPQILSTWIAYGSTPLVDSYYEAALYFRGAPPFWGNASPEQNHAAHPSTYRGSIASGINAATYISPITSECQNNAIVVLSDGQPFVSGDAATQSTRSLVKSMAGLTNDCEPVPGQVLPETAGNSLADGRCGAELASFLSTQDQSGDVEGDNTVQTYTVGFGVDGNPEAEGFLKSLALNGDGKYFPASNTSALVAAFKAIINDIDSPARSFAAPVYTVDPSSKLSHSDDIYLPLFENSKKPAWAGNIKKFKLNAVGKIVDANGAEAIDNDGALKPTAVDFWADSSIVGPTANPVTSGGAASNLTPSSRRLFTDNGALLVPLSEANITKLQLGNTAMTDAYKAQLVSYIQGYGPDGTTPRNSMGDILHSKPTVVSYNDKQVLFFGTNEGYLHAINTADSDVTGLSGSGGMEIFAYMPSSLLSNIEGIKKNVERTQPTKRIYGLDGPIASWIIDNNKNGKVDAGNGDKAYLFFGLRRGGSHYYALDITNPNNPNLVWSIGRHGAFSGLGESWSKPVLAKLRYKDAGITKLENVLVFGGGYDNRIDDVAVANSGSPMPDVWGNGIYIVNAKTGKLIWSYVGGDLKYSIPGEIRTLDVDRDGSIDRLYFGDTGGNIWRADLNIDDVDGDASLHDVKKDARVSQFARLGIGGGVNARKFFFEPDVSMFRHNGKNTIVLAVGTGYRPHPLNNDINDRFYVLYDENVFGIPSVPPAALTESDLIDSTILAGQNFLPNYKGWYKKLTNGQGEKVLASPVIFKNKVVFTTFSNTGVLPSQNNRACSALTGNQARAYVLDLMAASATADINSDGDITPSDESVLIPHGDILGSPQLVFNSPSNCNTEGCDQFVDIRIGKRLVPLVDKNTRDGNTNLGDFLPKVFWINEE